MGTCCAVTPDMRNVNTPTRYRDAPTPSPCDRRILQIMRTPFFRIARYYFKLGILDLLTSWAIALQPYIPS